MRWLNLAMIVATVGALAFVAAWEMFTARSAPSAAVAMRRADEPAPRIFADGVVEGASREISLRFEVPGRIKEVHVREGDAVKAGDVLAELDSEGAELQLAEARIQLKIAQAERDRLLADAGLAQRPRGQIDARQARVSDEEQTIADGKTALAETAVRHAQLLVDRHRLCSPADGAVLRVLPQPGEFTGPSDQRELFAFVPRGALRVRAFVEELDGLDVSVGQRALISAARPGKQHGGTVSSCSLSFHPKSQRLLKPGERLDIRVREVLIDLDDGYGLLIGMPVEVFIERNAAALRTSRWR